ncbi:INCE protein, partial [Regulus satrapa]|nr:INCE protein [Regulus satrapa]
IKDFIKCNTPTRPPLKVCHEKERQRLESLRKKQEAEEQRKKKVEEEKRRRQAEMKQKREERLRKAMQARERAEQMEEKKKKQMEQKILQSDEKVHISQVREEKVAGEQSKRKGSKNHGEVEAWKQRALRGPYRVFLLFLQEENEQQQPLQKRRENEVKERGKTVLELKNLLEQQQLGQAKERYKLIPVLEQGVFHSHGEAQQGKEKPSQAQQEPAALAGKDTKVGLEFECWDMHSVPFPSFSTENRRGLSVKSHCQGTESSDSVGSGFEYFGPLVAIPAGSTASLAYHYSVWFQTSLSTSCLGSLKVAQGSGLHSANKNSYGLDLNSDDSTDDESNPRKTIPAWADGAQLQQAIVHQYYQPVDVDALFGAIPSPRLEHIFYKSKPRYFKRTSSAVWHSPP